MSPLERRSLSLWPEEWVVLEALAAQLGALPPTGPNAGQPSWRSLVKEIARGNLVVARPESVLETETEPTTPAGWKAW